eukprot:10615291-Lingulodinium_polyedra.AAC.1
MRGGIASPLPGQRGRGGCRVAGRGRPGPRAFARALGLSVFGPVVVRECPMRRRRGRASSFFGDA